MHVEDIPILDALHDADGNVDKWIFVQYKQPVIGQCNNAVGSRPTQMLNTLSM